MYPYSSLFKPDFFYLSIKRLMVLSVPQTFEIFYQVKTKAVLGKPLPGLTTLRPAFRDRYQSQHVSTTGPQRFVYVYVNRLQRYPIPFDPLLYVYGTENSY